MTAHDSYSAWREEDHDDLVISVALAAWWGENGPKEGARYESRGGEEGVEVEEGYGIRMILNICVSVSII